MRIPKRYGQSKVEGCPFCGKQSTTTNKQGIPVCITHKDKELLDFKCLCGEWLDLKNGKYGPYFFCMKCGNISFSKGMEFNEEKLRSTPTYSTKPIKSKKIDVPLKSKRYNSTKSIPKKVGNETVITSDQLDAYYS